MKKYILTACVFLGLLAAEPSAFGQYTGENIRGDYGVNSGSQGPPGIYATIIP